MSAKHTPGPWRIREDCGGEGVVGADRTLVADCAIWDKRGRRPEEVCRANACLIAAAPELLDHAVLFERTIIYEIAKSEKAGDDEGARLATVTLNLLRATIAKARGVS